MKYEMKYGLSFLESDLRELLKKLKKHNTYASQLENEIILYKLEIERLNNDIKILLQENGNKEKVIKAQDNIINELEKYMNENYIYDDVGMKIFDASVLQDKLQELKGVDKE